MKIEKLTKEILLKAGREGRKVGGYVYICAKCSGKDAGVYLHINSATPSTYCAYNNVLEWLESGSLRPGYIVYAKPNIGQLDIDEFVMYFNERYADYF